MSRFGLHHVTAIAGPARRNLDFYTRTLGLRLVKKTVNFDDPGSWHLYYGNGEAEPGSILTFFPWERAAPGRLGTGETAETALRVPEGSIGFWSHRLLAEGIAHEGAANRFGETAITLSDPDGIRLALVGVPGIEAGAAWSTGEIPPEHAVRGLHGVSLLLRDAAATGAILCDVFGFGEAGREGGTIRFGAEGATLGGFVDIRPGGDISRGRSGRGSVHHIAFRAADDEHQAALVRLLAENHGIRTTEQKDRNYFRSVYFPEPGGVLFEIATIGPGFTADEPLDALGTRLKLPRQYERHRREIEAVLPPLDG